MLSARNRFQYQIATGRGTLPVAVILTLLIWAATSIHDWLNAGSLVAFGFASYLLLETETKFALIRTRTTAYYPSCGFLSFALCSNGVLARGFYVLCLARFIHSDAAESFPKLRIYSRTGLFVPKFPLLGIGQSPSSAFSVDYTFIIYTHHQLARTQRS